MLKIIKEQWDRNREVLRKALQEGENFNDCSYMDLVKLSFEKIYNEGLCNIHHSSLDLACVTEIDNGDYQGTYLYLIPFKTYQPSEYEYLMTYVGYGSCCGCDTLQAIQNFNSGKLTKNQVEDFMSLCKDILMNTIRPYNDGWRHNPDFDQVEMT